MIGESDVLMFRREAESLMVDTCTITRGSGGQQFDTAAGEYVQTVGVTLYSGRCRVKARDNADRVVDAGGQAVSLFPFTVSIPVEMSSFDTAVFEAAFRPVTFEVDDLVTVTASALDPALVDLVLRVRQVAAGTHLTARRLECEVKGG